MTYEAVQWRLGIDSPSVSPTATNYRLPSWPPPHDFPIVVDAEGRVVSRYGDAEWALWPWCRAEKVVNFGDGPQRRGSRRLSRENASLFRQIAAWWLYGPRPVRRASTLVRQCTEIRAILAYCTDQGIAASNLSAFPALIDGLAAVLRTSFAESLLVLLHRLFDDRQQVGFTILDPPALKRLAGFFPRHVRRQTPYIPPRIWAYQTNRLKEFLDEFSAHQEAICKCFTFSMDAYARNIGTHEEAVRPAHHRTQHRLPFERTANTGLRNGATYHGSFHLTARRFGIEDLLKRWVGGHNGSLEGPGRGVSLLSSYLNMAGYVGTAYLLTFSLMRIDECWNLRSSCLEIERDEHFGDIFLLKGRTTKTLDDDDARWITSPTCRTAVDVMRCASHLRAAAAKFHSTGGQAAEWEDPPLVVRPYEPWARKVNVGRGVEVRPICASYKAVLGYYPRLLDPEMLRITQQDLDAARLVTPTLDNSVYAVGKPWTFSWHQLRRTGAVNMLASGIVSDATLQYQLKHTNRAMSLYYGQGYSRRHLDSSTRDEYLRTMYEVVGKQVSALFSDRWVSPHGVERKAAALAEVSPTDARMLSALAKDGRVSWRETLFGGCLRRGYCQYGGIDNFVRCSGGDGRGACIDAVFDKDRAPQIESIGRLIEVRLAQAATGSPYRESLLAQRQAVVNVLKVIADD